MTLTQLLLDELDREAPRTRRALEHVPLGRDDWKPHPKSMPLGRLAGLVASMPSWVTLIIEQDELDLNPPAGRGQYQQPSTEELGDTLDKHVLKARESLSNTNDEFLHVDEMAAPCRGESRDGSAAACRSSRHAQPSRPSSGPVDRVSATQRTNGSGDLRAIRGRSAICVASGPGAYRQQ